MAYTILGLLILGLIVFIISFFKKDKLTDVENQMENLSVTLMQELHKVKKKQNELEEKVMQQSGNNHNQ